MILRKSVLIFVLLFFILLKTQGQTWHSYPTSNTVWNYSGGVAGYTMLFFQEIIGDLPLTIKTMSILKSVSFSIQIPHMLL